MRARQLLAASLALLAFLALAGYALDRAFVDTAEDNLRQRLKSYALYYTDKVEFGRNGTLIPPYNTPDPRFDMPDSGMYAQVVLQGVPPWGSNSTLGPELPVPQLLGALEESFEGPLPIRRADGSESQAYRYGVGYAWPATHQHAEIPYSIYILEDAQALSAQIRVFRGSLWVYLGGAGVILLLLQMLVLRWSLRPLRRVIFELSRVQRGELSGMTESHPRELEPLTDSINAFIESERENLERQRNTLADLAHSLKTPIAVLRTQLDNTADPEALRQELDVQLKRMNNLVSYQLARAASSGHKLFSSAVEIEPHAEEIVRGLEKVYASKGVICEFEIDPRARFHGETGDLQELMGNLLENAFKWARSRVLLTVEVGATAPQRRAGLFLAVDDDGPGIPPENLETVFERFYTSRPKGAVFGSNSGLGLSIVRQIVEAHGGRVHAENKAEGGARFEIVFPAVGRWS